MTGSEFVFLALGLALGVATGAAIVEVLRARAPAPREVRVTVAPGSVPGRAVTLATDPFAAGMDGPAAFGPGDRREHDRPTADPSHPTRTSVQEAGAPQGPVYAGIPVRPEPDPLLRVLRSTHMTAATTTARAGEPVAATVPAGRTATPGARPVPPIAAAPETGAGGAAVAAHTERTLAPAAAGVDRPAPSPVPSPPDGGPCEELRSVAEDRCAVARRAREGAETAQQSLHDAQRAYDEHVNQAEAAAERADPRAIRAAKEEAQARYRAAHGAASTREALEAAARDWLAEINRINAAARDGATRADRERAAANALVPVIERLGVEADAARISAEAAEQACMIARQAVADCEEAVATARPEAAPPGPEERYPEESPELPVETPWDQDPRIVRLLRGDRRALLDTVAELAGDDPSEQRRWQLAVTGLVDAIVAQAIEASVVDVPDEPAFWEPFTRSQRRDIVAALASLGYHYDGLGGFADGRVPSQRDLSLAVGYAGLDPMRIRRWPAEVEMAGLYAQTSVAADEYLAGAAGGLSLSEMVDLLGRRADGLTDLWNEWGRVRPRLLAVD